MGLALEWLSLGEREALALELLAGGKKKGAYISDLCPFHNEKTPSFTYRPDRDFFKCFGCGRKGDLIKLYEELRGQGREAKEVFREFKARYGPEDESGRPWSRRRFRPRPQVREWEPAEAGRPPDLWMDRAESFVAHSVERLWRNTRELARLKRWGLTRAAIGRGRLGWNDKWKSFSVEAWGLKPESEDDKIHLPTGLVIPLMEEGQVIRIKIRRPAPEAKPRYMQVKGGSNRLYLYGRSNKVMVVETERDALMLRGRYSRQGWSFLGTGSASARPCQLIHPLLKEARILAVAMDGDKAGFQAWVQFWQKVYPGAIWWPVPSEWGKDPGEAIERQHDLAEWLAACGAGG